MNATDLTDFYQQRLSAEVPDVVELVAGAINGMELAALALALPDLFALWGIESGALKHAFREVVRDRYAALAHGNRH